MAEQLDLDALERIAKAVEPKFWQRSFYAPLPSMKHDREAGYRADAYERTRVLRGPGVIGEPGCNPAVVFDRVSEEALAHIAAFNPTTALSLIALARTQAPAPSRPSEVLAKVRDWAVNADANGDNGYLQAQVDVHEMILASFAVRPLSEETT